MTTFLPEDSNDNPIPVMRMKQGGAHTISVGASSARNASAFDDETKVISLYASVPVYIAFGDSSVTAAVSDHYFPAGIYYDVAIGGEKSGQYTHAAVLRAEGDGTIYISEKN